MLCKVIVDFDSIVLKEGENRYEDENMIKVLMSSTTSMEKDGITNVILNLYKNIDRSIFIVDLIMINQPSEDIKKNIADKNGKYTVIPRRFSHPIRFIRQYSSACKNYDIVHVHGNSATIFLELFAAKLAGVPIRIAHSHNTYCRYKTIDKVLRFPFYLLCNERLACGVKAGKWLFNNRKFEVINNGIDAKKFEFDNVARNKIRSIMRWDNKKVIVHVGNFLEAKNHVFVIEIFKEIYKNNKNFRLLLLGNGELKTDVENIVKKYKLDDVVWFAGSVTNVSDYLNGSDIVLMPSINEGLPLTLIEEQANGLKCIVSKNITTEVNITGNVCFISLNDSVRTWSEKVIRCCNEYYDRETESERCVNVIIQKGYDITCSTKKLEDIYIKNMKYK